MTALELDAVSVRLGATDVLDCVSTTVEHGEWVAVVGPNGAGKSTLLRAVAGLVRFRGTIRVGGADAVTLARGELARRLSFVPQEPLLPPDMTVADYVLLGRTPYLGYLGAEGADDVAAAIGALERLDLLAFARRKLRTLSGGERQRAVLARALAQDAPLLLLDEPTTALDVGRQQQVLELVDRLRVEDGLTVVAAIHDLTVAAQYSERLLLLDGGRVVTSGAPEAVVTEELLSVHFGADVRVVVGPDGVLAVVPARKSVRPAGC